MGGYNLIGLLASKVVTVGLRELTQTTELCEVTQSAGYTEQTPSVCDSGKHGAWGGSGAIAVGAVAVRLW